MNLIFFSIICLICTNNLISAKKRNQAEKCSLCENLISKFAEGLKRTQKGNFGGGNTDWEDRKLGNYLTSETRFEEIIETVCSETDCHALLESTEDTLLTWFKKHQKLDNFETKLKNEICIEELKYCCPLGTYGYKCVKCPQNSAFLICSGNGKCHGEGTRSNGDTDGKCDCDKGYKGDLCQECETEHYYVELKNETFTRCSECHRTCQKCSGPNADSCSSCRDGWSMNQETNLCEDINECLVKENACNSDQFCENNDGSYVCHDCDQSCSGCTSSGNNKCLECKQGYKSTSIMNLICEDINECEETSDICGSDKTCLNTPGSFECKGQKKSKNSNKNVKIENENKELTKRSLVLGLILLCLISGYFTQQYLLFMISSSLGLLIIYFNY